MTIGEQLKGKDIHIENIDSSITEKQFFDAVKSRNHDKIMQFINKGIDVNVKDRDGCSALMHATDSDDYKTVRLLVEFDADIDVKDDDGQTPLMNCAFVNARKSAKFLITHGANVNLKDKSGQTALMLAALSDSKEVGEMLILNGADVDAKDNEGMTAYEIAAKTWGFKKNVFFLSENFSKNDVSSKKNTTIDCQFNDYFSNKDYGDVITSLELKESFKNIGNLEEKIFTFINASNEIKTRKFIKVIDGNRFLIMPSCEDVQSFLNTVFFNKTGKIKRCELRNKFKQEYNVDLCEINLGSYITKYDNVSLDENGDFLLVPSKKEIENFLSSYGKLSEAKMTHIDIRNSFFQKYGIDLEENIVNNYMKQYEKKVDEFLVSFIEKESQSDIYIFSFKELNESFKAKYFYALSREKFLDFVRCRKGMGRSVIQEVQEGVFVRIPSGINTEFIKDLFNCEPPRKFFAKELKCVLNSLDKLNSVIKKQGVELRSLTYDSDCYILTFASANSLSFFTRQAESYLRRKFLYEKVGYSCTINDIENSFNYEYDLKLDTSLFKMAVYEANKHLLDIQIICEPDGITIKSDFKWQTLPETRVFCPICKLDFRNYKEVREHILILHTTVVENCSILTCLTSGYYCHHCKRSKLDLDAVSPNVTLEHINGNCKSFGEVVRLETYNYVNRKIWKGTIYSNDASTLGNSGQMFRDRGQFGSFPSEDNYGNGDTNF